MGFKRRGAEATRRAAPWSVRTYLLSVVAVAVIAVLAALGYGFFWSAHQARDRAQSGMELQSRRAATGLSTAVVTGRKTVDALAAQTGLEVLFSNKKAASACQLSADGSGPFSSVRVDMVAPDGTVACTSARSPRVTAPGVHAGSAWLRAALRGGATRIDWRGRDAAARTNAVTIAAPLTDGRRTVGAVVLFLHVPMIASTLAQTVAGAQHESFTVVDRQTGAIVAASEAPAPDAPQFPVARRSGDWTGVDGANRLFGSSDVRGAPWRVYAGERRSTVLADVRGTFERQALIGLLVLLVLLAAVLLLNRRVVGPLRELTAAVARARREPERTRVQEAGPAELRTLARAFNAMLDVRAGHDAQLVHQATHDPLTGLPNQQLLRERLGEVLRQDARGGVAVLWIGVGRLDIVTEGFGHGAGDRLVAEVSARLSEVAAPGDMLARVGGAEFVLLLTGAARGAGAAAAERVHQALNRPFRGPDGEIVLQAAIGGTRAEPGASAAGPLLREADSAMREARSTGRRFTEFDGALQHRATRHLAVEREIRQALERDEFLVYYQPLVDVETRTVTGTEALVRWRHPERGLVPPMQFVPIAEETGQIAAIGGIVLRRACAQAAAWTTAGHPLRMSVNVAVGQLRDPGFPALVAETLADTGLAPEQLCLELTESSLVGDVEHAGAALGRLRDLGVHVAIDDFGTGYSSLSYLHNLPVDELKIDRSFIARLGGEGAADRDGHMVEAIVGMARALGLSVVAEGVETDAQLAFLSGLRCPVAQGYLFAEPRPAEAILALVGGARETALLGASR
jgi:diguanylate cyclase (GGDEF)-like protein